MDVAKLSRGRSPTQVASVVLFFAISIAWAGWHVGTHLGVDAAIYSAAGRAIALGRDPYESAPGYIYPPFLATVLGLVPLSWHWLWGAVVALSAPTLLYATLVIARLHTSKGAALAALLLLGYGFEHAAELGNAQLPVAALLASALAALDRERYRTAGALLGLAAAIKVTPALLILLLLARAVRDRPAARAAAVATLVGVASLCSPWTGRWIELTATGIPTADRSWAGSNISWYAFVAQAGGHLPAFVPSLLAVVATLWLARSRRWGLVHAAAITIALALAGTPVSWGFAYVTLLPVLAVAFRELARGHHFVGDVRGRSLIEYGALAALTSMAVSADHFYMREFWAGRHLLPLYPLLGTLLVAGAIAGGLRAPKS